MLVEHPREECVGGHAQRLLGRHAKLSHRAPAGSVEPRAFSEIQAHAAEIPGVQLRSRPVCRKEILLAQRAMEGTHRQDLPAADRHAAKRERRRIPVHHRVVHHYFPDELFERPGGSQHGAEPMRKAVSPVSFAHHDKPLLLQQVLRLDRLTAGVPFGAVSSGVPLVRSRDCERGRKEQAGDDRVEIVMQPFSCARKLARNKVMHLRVLAKRCQVEKRLEVVHLALGTSKYSKTLFFTGPSS